MPPPSHITVVDAIPVTGPGRTLFDLAATTPVARLERALDSSLGRGLVDIAALRGFLQDLGGRGRRGVGVMRRLLDDRGPEFMAPASELERRVLGVLVDGGLPAPRTQVWAGGSRVAGGVDLAYTDAGLVIEADSRRHHMSKLDFENDRQRDNVPMAAGWRVLRITWQQVNERPDEVVRLVREALRAAA